jgi:uncharacterized protein (TIGR02996 family)
MTAIDADPAAGFLAAVLADPADDVPRMAYADWLTERGDPRGEFVAVQLELARGAGSCPCPVKRAGGANDADRPQRCLRCPWCRLKRRERDLFAGAAVLRVWFPGTCFDGFVFLTDPPRSSSEADAPFAVVRRGFVGHVELTLKDFEAHAAALFAAAPVEGVRLADREPVSRYEGVCWVVPNGTGEVASCREPHHIPRALAKALTVRNFDGSALGNIAAFRRRKDADAWLSAAAVAFGRKAAGLTPLPAKAVAREA